MDWRNRFPLPWPPRAPAWSPVAPVPPWVQFLNRPIQYLTPPLPVNYGPEYFFNNPRYICPLAFNPPPLVPREADGVYGQTSDSLGAGQTFPGRWAPDWSSQLASPGVSPDLHVHAVSPCVGPPGVSPDAGSFGHSPDLRPPTASPEQAKKECSGKIEEAEVLDIISDVSSEHVDIYGESITPQQVIDEIEPVSLHQPSSAFDRKVSALMESTEVDSSTNSDSSFFKNVFNYLAQGKYPSSCNTKGDKANFRRQCKPFHIQDGKLYHRSHKGRESKEREEFPEYALVVSSSTKQKELIKMAHQGTDSSLQSTSLSAHRGMKTTTDVLLRRVWWPRISIDVKDYVRTCDVCQKVNMASIKCKEPLKPVPPPKENMKQIGIDIIQLPETNGFKYAVIGIDYFSKYCHGKALENKTAVNVAKFLFEWICLFGCPKVIINDQGREFCNQVSNELCILTGVQQRVTRAYNPQANGQVERQNRTIKCSLLKVLRQHITNWPDILDGVMFAHRTQVQRSTGYSPFFLLFNREPSLPVDLAMNIELCEKDDEDGDLMTSEELAREDGINLDTFIQDNEKDLSYEDIKEHAEKLNEFVNNFNALKTKVHAKARENILDSQSIQKKHYDKRHASGQEYVIGDLVLRRNLRRRDRKGDWRQDPWSGPYKISEIMLNRSCRLISVKTGKVLAELQSQRNLKHFHERADDTTCKDLNHEPQSSAAAPVLNDLEKPTRVDVSDIIGTNDPIIELEQTAAASSTLTDLEKTSPFYVGDIVCKKGTKSQYRVVSVDDKSAALANCVTTIALKSRIKFSNLKLVKRPSSCHEPIAILPNGNRLLSSRAGDDPDNDDKEGRVSLSNTCGFDSIVQLIAVSMHDSNKYRKYANLNPDIPIFLLANTLMERDTDALAMRSHMLRPHFENVVSQNNVIVQCEAPLMRNIDLFFKRVPTATDNSTCNSDECPRRIKQTQVVAVSLSTPKEGLEAIRDRLFAGKTDTTCLQNVPKNYKNVTLDHGKPMCNGKRSHTRSFSPGHILLELVDQNPHRTVECRSQLKDIPVLLEDPAGTVLSLRGLVAFEGPKSCSGGIGHYKAYARRACGCWEVYDDLKDTCENANPLHEVRSHLFLYTI